MSTTTRELLVKLRFIEVWGEMTDQEPSYRYEFGNFDLRAVQITSVGFRGVFKFSGVLIDRRTLQNIDFELPLELDSEKQGTAMLAYYLRSKLAISDDPAWLEQGRTWERFLPWNLNKK